MTLVPKDTTSILEVIRKGWDAIVEMYKHSDKETKEKILKMLIALGGFGALLKYLKSL